MTIETNKDRIAYGWLFFMILAGFLIMFGVFMVQEAFAINATAIDETQLELIDEITFDNSFPAFWLVFLLIVLAFFMLAMFKMREDRETVFFSIGALIVSLLITIMLTSPIPFDYQQSTGTIELIANDTQVIQATVTQTTNQIIIIPANDEFRLALSLLFTGLSLFNGLYSMYIITNFHVKGLKETFSGTKSKV